MDVDCNGENNVIEAMDEGIKGARGGMVKTREAECLDLLSRNHMLWFDLLGSSSCYSSPTAAPQPAEAE